MSAVCDICGKEFKNTQGLRGHKNFVHGHTGSSKMLSAPAATEQPVSRLRARLGLTDSKTEPITEQLSNIENRLTKLESITGVKELSELEKLLGITEKPITEQLERHTHQLAELSEQLENLSRQLKLASSNTELRNVNRKVTQLSEQVKRHDSWLTPDPVVAIFSKDSYDCPAFLRDLDCLQTRVKDHQGAIDWVRKKFNLVKRRDSVN